MAESTNKRIAKNAVMLTLRSILVALIGLYTSRVVLETLGVDDFGIYGVVGGVIGMVSFLNTSMAGATSRFITFELGKNDEQQLAKTFSTALRIHFFIALIVVLLGETVGLWFLNTKMNFPEGKLFAANVLYQFTVFSVLVSFTQVPYNAAIIAHERMSIYAYFEIIFVVLKLSIVFVLLVIPDARLIWYGAMTLAVSIINALFYRGYCLRHFKETQAYRYYDRQLAKSMLKFSGYDMYGNMSVAAQKQGQPLLLNLFFGVVANAGASIAANVSTAITALTSTVSQAFRPQIIKNYANMEIETMRKLMIRTFQFYTCAFTILVIPLLIETPRILNIWLGQVPDYSILFTRFVLFACYIGSLDTITNIGVHATGNIKLISFGGGSIFLLTVISAYVLFKLGFPAQTIYATEIVGYVIILSIACYSLYKQIEAFGIKKLIMSLSLCLVSFMVSITLTYLICKTIPFLNESYQDHTLLESLLVIVVVTLIGMLISGLLNFLIVFNKSDRDYLKTKLQSLLLKKTACL